MSRPTVVLAYSGGLDTACILKVLERRGWDIVACVANVGQQEELAYAALPPDLEIISPWKEQQFLDRLEGRQDLLAYAREHGIEVDATTEKPYSTDENLMHGSCEAGLPAFPGERL